MTKKKIRTAQDVLMMSELLTARVFKVPCGGYVVASKCLIDTCENLKHFRQVYRIDNKVLLVDGKLIAKYWKLPIYDPTDHRELFKLLAGLDHNRQELPAAIAA